jgi:hypothetical protein
MESFNLIYEGGNSSIERYVIPEQIIADMVIERGEKIWLRNKKIFTE